MTNIALFVLFLSMAIAVDWLSVTWQFAREHGQLGRLAWTTGVIDVLNWIPIGVAVLAWNEAWVVASIIGSVIGSVSGTAWEHARKEGTEMNSIERWFDRIRGKGGTRWWKWPLLVLIAGVTIFIGWLAVRRTKTDYSELASLRKEKFAEHLEQRQAQVKAEVMEEYKVARYHRRRITVLNTELEELSERMGEIEDAYVKKVETINRIRSWRDLRGSNYSGGPADGITEL